MFESFVGLFKGSSLFIREWGNSIIYPMAFWLAGVTAYYIMQTYRQYPLTWRTEKGVAFACAFLWIFLAEGVRGVVSWAALDATRDGAKLPAFVEELSSMLYMVSAMALVAIFVRCIWLLAPKGSERLTLGLSVVWTGFIILIAEIVTLRN